MAFVLDAFTRTWPKSQLVGFSDAIGATPRPVSGMLCGVPAASSERESVPLSLFITVGVNTTVMVQLA